MCELEAFLIDSKKELATYSHCSELVVLSTGLDSSFRVKGSCFCIVDRVLVDRGASLRMITGEGRMYVIVGQVGATFEVQKLNREGLKSFHRCDG